MATPALRPIQKPRDDKGWDTLIADIQENFRLLAAAPLLVDAVTGTIIVFVKEADGTWRQWSFIAGGGVTFTKNATARTLTLSAP